MKQIQLDENIQTMLICAERYACGRRTYMPDIVQQTITPLIPYLSLKTLHIMDDDLNPKISWDGYFGDPETDQPGWMRFREEIKKEIDKRKRSDSGFFSD